MVLCRDERKEAVLEVVQCRVKKGKKRYQMVQVVLCQVGGDGRCAEGGAELSGGGRKLCCVVQVVLWRVGK